MFYDPNDTWTRTDGCKDVTPDDTKPTPDKPKPSKSSQLSIAEQKSKLGLITDKPSVGRSREAESVKSDHSSSLQEIPVKDTSPVR